MVGASDWAGILGGYFENDKFSARLVWNYRAAYVSSGMAPSTNTKRAQYRYSEEEQQKLDVSGRMLYVNVKYKF